MNRDFNRILVLSPHTDDLEFGAGGTVARWIEEGKEIFSVVFSTSEESVPTGFPKNVLEVEAKKAQNLLGIKPENLLIEKFKVRMFPAHRQEILEMLVSLRNLRLPDLVLIPSPRDIHQDHHTVSEEAIRAFKGTTILGYEEPWNLLDFNSCCLVLLEERHIQKKIEAIESYRSQAFRKYSDPDLIKGLAKVRGVQAGANFAEAFEVIRWVIK